jgi:uncharacterized protein (DUF302 family)
MAQYTFQTRLDTDPADAEQRIRQALAEEGFGILTEIDVQATLKQKLDLDMRPYKILGACNPPLAHQAIETDEDIGALLPCNVVVRSHPDGGTEIVAADPEAMLGISPHADDLAGLAADAKQRIQRAFDTVSG